MKKEHCVLILICCFLMAACGRLEDIPEDLSAFPETERKETAETPAGPQFETLTVADDPITAEFSLTNPAGTSGVSLCHRGGGLHDHGELHLCLPGPAGDGVSGRWGVLGTAGGIGGGIRRHPGATGR